jgi:clan AA aspartic protease
MEEQNTNPASHAVPLTDVTRPFANFQVSNYYLEGQKLNGSALLDTGFTGYLSLPISVVDTLKLPVLGQSNVEIADGSQVVFDIVACRLFFDFLKMSFVLPALASDNDEPIIGMSLLQEVSERFSIDFEQGLINFDGLRY